MPKKGGEKKTRRNVFLYDSDWEFLQSRFGQGNEHRLSASTAICAIVHAKVLQMKAREQDAVDDEDEDEDEPSRPVIKL